MTIRTWGLVFASLMGPLESQGLLHLATRGIEECPGDAAFGIAEAENHHCCLTGADSIVVKVRYASNSGSGAR